MNYSLWGWFRRFFTGLPHFRIGPPGDPYMLRWFIIPRNRRFNIYLHKFLRDDDDRALHDHPWWFVSLILKGGYFERVEPNRIISRSPGSIAFRPATHRHRVILRGNTGQREPCWTIVVTGRKKRTWGFWCPKGFVPWHEFVQESDHGNIGRGCGEME